MEAVGLGFEFYALGHGVGDALFDADEVAVFKCGGAAQVSLISTSPPSKRQERHQAVGGHAEAVAGFAEGVAHGADETDAADTPASCQC